MSQIAISGNASGTGVFTVQSPNSNTNYSQTLPAATGTYVLDTNTQTLTNKTLTSPTITSPTIDGTPVMGASLITTGTSQTTTSGTTKDFTSIPSWVKRITLLLNGVSTNGSSALLVQLGAGSVTTTGYNSMAFTNATLGTSTIGLLLTQAVNSGLSQYGSYTISLFGSNTWILQGVGYQSPSFGAPAAGQIALGGTLDRLRLTTVNGTDTFDAGSVNILYE